MPGEKHQRYHNAIVSSYCSEKSFVDHLIMLDGNDQYPGLDVLTLLQSRKIFIVNSRRRNGLILFKQYHAEFAGPGAAVGGECDDDCQWVLPIGNLSLLTPESHEEIQKAYLIRRQWIRLIRQITENQVSGQRVQKILDQFEQYFPPEMVSHLPDIAFALLVGVLPQTVGIVRRGAIDLLD